MITPQEKRLVRLKNDYGEMQNIMGTIIGWQAVAGQVPYVEAYELRVRIKTIIGPAPNYRDVHNIQVTLLPNYPDTPPTIVMQSHPQPFHPNWYTGGKYCYGKWDFTEGLGDHIIRMIRTLQFDPEITDPNSAANSVAKQWYLSNINLHPNWFPCDHQVLPDPSGRKTFTVHKTFRVE